MIDFYKRFLRLIFGLFLYALGVVVTLNANIGYAPWDVFHAGLAKVTGISFGNASILVGLALVVAALLLKEKLGLGTLCNMVLIGTFIDLILAPGLLPKANSFALGTVMMIAGLFIIAVASYFYIGSGFGAGPRDSMMVALNRRTKLPVGACRGIIEFSALAVGWLLGGMVGVGTLISVAAIGPCVQLTFRLLRFEPTKVAHETLDQTLARFMKKEP